VTAYKRVNHTKDWLALLLKWNAPEKTFGAGENLRILKNL
jgi:hypothetical protein